MENNDFLIKLIFFCRYNRIAQAVKIIFAIATFISYGLQGYVPVSIIWGTYLSKKYEHSDRKLCMEFTTRILIVIATCKWSRKYI